MFGFGLMPGTAGSSVSLVEFWECFPFRRRSARPAWLIVFRTFWLFRAIPVKVGKGHRSQASTLPLVNRQRPLNNTIDAERLRAKEVVVDEVKVFSQDGMDAPSARRLHLKSAPSAAEYWL
jgi:hypothetical protein